jgi:two-component system, OmpR family, sensor histidine kinase QseC
MTLPTHFALRSLKKQLLFFLLTALLSIWSATAYISYQRSRVEVAELFNAELAQSARVVHAFVENLLRQKRLTKLWDPDKIPELFDMPILGYKYERKIAFQLRSIKEGVVLRSESAPEFALSLTRNGYSETMLGDQLWHVFSISSENGDYVIHVGQRDDIRQQLTDAIADQEVVGMLAALPILGVLIWLIVNRILRPLDQLRLQLAAREAGHLQPLKTEYLPEELVPLVAQVNTLFSLLEQAFANERNFTSDASHELRTPLAGLMTQLQVAQKTLDADVHNQALQKAQQAVVRMTHMVQQLLTLARVQHQDAQPGKQVMDLREAAITVIGDLEYLAHDKDISIELQSAAGYLVDANPQLLNILLRNLVDNAIKYTPAGGNIRIRIGCSDEQIWLSVEDDGPGVVDEDYERLTQRFYRCVETANKADGSGLGLSIAQRIIRLHNAQISFSKAELGGLKALLQFLPSQL